MMLFVLLAILNALEINSNFTSLTFDFLEKQGSPVKVTSFLCSDKTTSAIMWKALSHKYHVSFQKILEVPRSDHQVFLLDLKCNYSRNILEQAHNLKLLHVPYKWIVYGDSSILGNYYIDVYSQVYVVQENELKTVYKPSAESQLIESNVGVWSLVDGFVNYKPLCISKNRSNLMGTVVKVSYVVTNLDTMIHLMDYRYKHIDAQTKVGYHLLDHLTQYLNGTMEFLLQNTWGYKNTTTGLYSGIVGDVISGKADLGGTSLFFTKERLAIIDYLAETSPDKVNFIFRAPTLSSVTNIFTLPFATSVWLYSIGLVILIIFIMYLIVKWEWNEPLFSKKIKGLPATLKSNFFDIVIMEISVATQQGTDVEPKSHAGRIATIFTLFSLMFLYTAYAATIVALLQSTSDSIRTLEDLLSSRFQLGAEDIAYNHYYFKTAVEPTRKAIYEQKVAPKGQKPNFLTVYDGIQRVQKGSFGLNVEVSTGYNIVSNIFQEGEKCSLREMSYVPKVVTFLPIQRNSAYKEIMKVGMWKLMEFGLKQRQVRKIYARKPACTTTSNQFSSVSIVECSAAFVILAIGTGFGILVLLLEIIIKKLSIKIFANNITV